MNLKCFKKLKKMYEPPAQALLTVDLLKSKGAKAGTLAFGNCVYMGTSRTYHLYYTGKFICELLYSSDDTVAYYQKSDSVDLGDLLLGTASLYPEYTSYQISKNYTKATGRPLTFIDSNDFDWVEQERKKGVVLFGKVAPPNPAGKAYWRNL